MSSWAFAKGHVMARRSRTVVFLTIAAVGSAYLLAAFNALAHGFASHGAMSSHRSMGSFSDMHAHQPFSPVRPPPPMLPAPTATVTTGTATTGTGAAGAGTT